MPIKVSSTFKKKKERVEWLEKNANKISSGILKGHAQDLIDTFHDGILHRDFPLKDLKPGTIAGKRYASYDYPEVPLVGKGDRRQSKRDTYINMMRMKRVKKGWAVYVSTGNHWSGVPLKKIFEVHEKGAKIAHKNGTIVQIPKRPAWRYAVKQWKSELKETFAEEYQRMIKGWIARGSWKKQLDKFVQTDKAKDSHETK